MPRDAGLQPGTLMMLVLRVLVRQPLHGYAIAQRIRQGVEIQLDGNPAQVIDLSVIGAQVISPTILRPNQRVRISRQAAYASVNLDLTTHEPKMPTATPGRRAA